MPRKRAPNGEPKRWLDTHLAALIHGDECIDWPYAKNGAGYGRISIDRRARNVPALVLEAFHGPPPPKHEVSHLCHNPSCVNPNHLEWATHLSNVRLSIAEGRADYTGPAKLTARQVRSIRYAHEAAVRESVRALADEYGVAALTIDRLVRGETHGQASVPAATSTP